jgi:hypothetical protein
MKSFLKIIIPVILLPLSFISCESIEKGNDVPEIKFISLTPYEIDTLSSHLKAGELIFSFIDGNADIGVEEGATSGDTLNFFLIPFQKKTDGSYQSINDTLRYRIRNDEKLTRTGQNKTIKGEIKLQIYYFITPPYDTLHYEFYIIDRAGNHSNTETTSDIGFH